VARLKATTKEINVSHILVNHKHEAEDIERQLQKGKCFGELAQKYSQCSSAKNSGLLGLVAITRLDEDFAQAALLLKTNEISKPVRTRFGFHLILRHS
jgi:parvulin-like peptidyl-prolyl isomerase